MHFNTAEILYYRPLKKYGDKNRLWVKSGLKSENCHSSVIFPHIGCEDWVLKKPKLRFNFREYLKFEGEHETEIKIRDSSQSFTRFTDLIQRVRDPWSQMRVVALHTSLSTEDQHCKPDWNMFKVTQLTGSIVDRSACARTRRVVNRDIRTVKWNSSLCTNVWVHATTSCDL